MMWLAFVGSGSLSVANSPSRVNAAASNVFVGYRVVYNCRENGNIAEFDQPLVMDVTILPVMDVTILPNLVTFMC